MDNVFKLTTMAKFYRVHLIHLTFLVPPSKQLIINHLTINSSTHLSSTKIRLFIIHILLSLIKRLKMPKSIPTQPLSKQLKLLLLSTLQLLAILALYN